MQRTEAARWNEQNLVAMNMTFKSVIFYYHVSCIQLSLLPFVEVYFKVFKKLSPFNVLLFKISLKVVPRISYNPWRPPVGWSGGLVFSCVNLSTDNVLSNF